MCRGLTRSWSMSLSLDLHPLRLGRGTRSGAAPSCFRKKNWGCDRTVCIAGGVAQACLGTAPSGAGVGTYECGACENLLTVLDMVFACEQRADVCGGGVGATAPVWSPGNCHHQVAGGLPLLRPGPGTQLAAAVLQAELEGGRGVSASLAWWAPSLEELASRTRVAFGPGWAWCVLRRTSHPGR